MNLFEQLGELYKTGFTPAQVQSIIKIMGTGTSTGTDTGTGTDTNTNTPTNTPTPTTTPATIPGAPSATVPANTNNQPQLAEKKPETTAANSGSVSGSTPEGPEKSEQSETVTLLREMLGLIQKGNINQMTGTSAAPTDGAEVLASILNPTTK